MTTDSTQPTRRDFVKNSTAAVATAASLTTMLQSNAHAQAGDETIGVAVIGCGGRGGGAITQALSTAGPVKLVAMGDMFTKQAEALLENLKAGQPDRVAVGPDDIYTGFDAYKKVIDRPDVDVVILTTPPGFRPIQFAYAVEKGKHAFLEKPVAVDPEGIRQVLAAAEIAKQKNLKVGVGLQRHHSTHYLQIMKQIHDGAIGDILYLQATWIQGGIKVAPRQPGQSEMSYQLKNWPYFNWLSGDHIVEQHVHNLDICNWAMNDYPIRAEGTGGRERRRDINYGNIFDHHCVEFTYANGAKMFSHCRQIDGTRSQVSEAAVGTKGRAHISGFRIEPFEGDIWSYKTPRVNGRRIRPNPYQVEHDDLFNAIRQNLPYNEAEYGAHSTMTGIMGRMATYSGKIITLKRAMESPMHLTPDRYALDGTPPAKLGDNGLYTSAVPGVTDPYAQPS